MPKLLRSFLFVLADRPDRIEKAAAMQADVVVVELEDGVAQERKSVARDQAGRMLAQLDFNGEVAVRVNRAFSATQEEVKRAKKSWRL